MVIERNGKKIVLTREELEKAYAIIQKEKDTGIPADISEGGFKGDNCNRVVVPLPNGDDLVAEAGSEKGYYEIFVSTENPTDRSYYQDLAIVGASYSYPKDAPVTDPVKTDPNKYSVKVYADENKPDEYTHEFTINRYPGDET